MSVQVGQPRVNMMSIIDVCSNTLDKHEANFAVDLDAQ